MIADELKISQLPGDGPVSLDDVAEMCESLHG
jgi:hypothetical protein